MSTAIPFDMPGFKRKSNISTEDQSEFQRHFKSVFQQEKCKRDDHSEIEQLSEKCDRLYWMISC